MPASTTVIGTTDAGQTEVAGQATTHSQTTGHTITNCAGKTAILFLSSNVAGSVATIKKAKTQFRAGSHGIVQLNDITVTIPASGAGGQALVYPPGIDYAANGVISYDLDANFADIKVSAWNLEER
jgi:hypothetical protein